MLKYLHCVVFRCILVSNNNNNKKQLKLTTMKSAVKTEERAIEILNEWLNSKLNDSNLLTSTSIQTTSCRCECGETICLMASFEADNSYAYVAVCDCCGDDDNFKSDVLEIR